MTRQAQLLPPRQLNPHIAPHVEAAILRAMAPAPDDRFQTVADLRAALVAPPTQRMDVEATGAQVPKAPARLAEPVVAAPAPSSPAQPVGEAGRRRPKPSRKANALAEPIPAKAVPQASAINGKRAAIFALLGAFLGAIGPAGLFGGALLILGLVAYHARHVLRHHRRQYQVEVLSLWLCAVPGYVLHLLITGWDADEALGSLFGIPIALWFPSAMLGSVVLWVARRVALRKRR
jgi:hypothetical protein